MHCLLVYALHEKGAIVKSGTVQSSAIQARREACELLCIGIAGTELLEQEAVLLAGGVRNVILFARNYRDSSQLTQLAADIRAAAQGPVLISVDQEGGRVQRFCGAPFPDQPAARDLGHQGENAVAKWTCETALALRACGVNMNLAPVLDVDSNPKNPVIGDRSLSRMMRESIRSPRPYPI